MAFVCTPSIAALQPWITTRRVLAAGSVGSGVLAGKFFDLTASYTLVRCRVFGLPAIAAASC